MRTAYDILFITTIPSFYKVNLFNLIAEKRRILVIYTGSNGGTRSEDFCKVEANYPYIKISKNRFLAALHLCKILASNKFKRIIVSGWDNVISYIAVILHPKYKNGCIVESSILESKTKGIKAIAKRLLLKRVSTVYASGILQRKLVHALGFNGKIIEFGGCGILNYSIQPPFEPRNKVIKFLFVGRLIKVKNLPLLIAAFNELPDLELTIIGTGPMTEELKQMAKKNIRFLGAINNKELPRYYQEADVFVLPSESEVWGLVVEEALNNGTPVIISSAVGCAESIVAPYHSGIIFDSNNKESLIKAIREMCNIEFYNRIRENVSLINFIERSKQQVNAFIE